MDALLNLEPRDAGLLAEPYIEFATSADDLHDQSRAKETSVCVWIRTCE